MPKFIEFILDILFPRFCISCRKEGSYFCFDCAGKLVKSNKNFCVICNSVFKDGNYYGLCDRCYEDYFFDGVFFYFSYKDEIIKDLIGFFKYKFIYKIGDDIIDVIKNNIISDFEFIKNKKILIAPVPLSPDRYVARGFNQSAILGNNINKIFKENNFDSIFVDKFLIRNKNTEKQAFLGKDEREGNIKNSFSLNHKIFKKEFLDSAIIIVDDIITTGNTFYYCSKLLSEYGFKNIYCLSICH